MKILFVGFTKSSERHAYNHRIRQIEQHCRKLGAETSLLFVGDLLFCSPVLIQPLNLPFILKYLRNFDVVSAEGPGAAYFFALTRLLIGRSTLVVYDVHSDNITESYLTKKGLLDFAGLFTSFQMRLTEYVARTYTDYFTVAWPDLKQRLLSRKRKLKAENVEVVLNGVDLESFMPPKEKKCNYRSKAFTVTYAGSFFKVEGTDTLIRAAEILRNEEIFFKLIGFGNSDLSKKKEIRRRLGGKVELLNWLSRDELVAELCKSDVLVIPADSSSCEQSKNRFGLIPTKFAEYLALSKPVIVTRLDGTSKIVEQSDCGFVCEPTAESIAETIRAAKETPSEILLLKGLNGRKLAEREFDYNSICKKYLLFLQKILEERGLLAKKYGSKPIDKS
jgi:glycosyltransferase involved in cell wall biosynthesis